MRWIAVSVVCCFLSIGTLAQIPVEELEKEQYHANNEAETLEGAAFATFFEETNVGNLHIYSTAEPTAELDYFFRGTPLPEGLYGVFPREWREELPGSVNVQAVYAIKGDAKPYYILRLEGTGSRNTLELFEMVDGALQHRQTLAIYWCEAGQCLQQDAWLQDLDGDTRFDLIKKVRIWGATRGKEIGEYNVVLKQLENGEFEPTGTIPVELNDYRMEELQRGTGQ